MTEKELVLVILLSRDRRSGPAPGSAAAADAIAAVERNLRLSGSVFRRCIISRLQERVVQSQLTGLHTALAVLPGNPVLIAIFDQRLPPIRVVQIPADRLL